MTKALGFAELMAEGMENSRRRKSLFCFAVVPAAGQASMLNPTGRIVGGVMEKALAAGEANG